MLYRNKVLPFILILPALSFLILFFFIPSVYNFKISLTDVSLLAINEGGDFVGFENYHKLLHDPKFWRAFKNTALWLTAFTVLLRLVIGLPLALLFNSKVLVKRKLSGVVRSLLLVPWATPPIVAVAVWKWILDPQFGIINLIFKKLGLIQNGVAFFSEPLTVWFAIAVIVVWNQLPFVIISLLAGLQSVPEELQEAAKVDGATSFQILSRVTLPLLYPTIGIVLMLTTIWTFNNFVYVWLSTRGGPGDVTNVLATQVYMEAFSNYRLGYSSAIGIMMTIILLIVISMYLLTMLKRGGIE